ncbi:MAG: iron ABC transporter permease [Spirochaetales bacterium]|nr:iron ABC transporter permease [Spirochaetales bacterium]
MQRQLEKRKTRLRILVLGIAAAVLAVLSLGIGRYWLNPVDIIKVLAQRISGRDLGMSRNAVAVIMNIRMPRILASLLLGAGLALSGQTFQMIFRNPLVSPDVLGTSSASSFGASLALLLGLTSFMVSFLAFACGIAALLLIYTLASRTKREQTLSLILVGMVVSSLFSAATSFVKLVADPENVLPAITYFLMGSLSGINYPALKLIVLPMGVSFAVLLLLSWKINLLSLSEDEARSLGVNTKLIRAVAVTCATVLVACSVSVAGNIGWVGLIVPHISRMLVSNDARYSFPSSMFIGASILTVVDCVSRAAATIEIPIGILTAFIGAPFFLLLLFREVRYDS